MINEESPILNVKPLGFPWETRDPFLFCVYHADAFPNGNKDFGPDASLDGRNTGNDFVVKDGWRMYHGTSIPGFPVHPHRGFETVTVVRKGINWSCSRFGLTCQKPVNLWSRTMQCFGMSRFRNLWREMSRDGKPGLRSFQDLWAG